MVLMKNINNKGYQVNKHENQRNSKSYKWDIIHEEGREEIGIWRDKRLRVKGARKTYHEFLIYSFDFDTLKSFFQNINFMVVIQMAIAMIAVYIFQTFKISFDVHVSLFVSPIVFPLAFSINTDFQRREKVLEDLAVFKSSGMVWYFCMREWKQSADLDNDWITAVYSKLKSLLFHLREYLLTCKPERRKIILRAMYEDFSDTNQLIEKVRASKLPANTAIISRSVHLLNMMCLSFERLRVIREYRSPRSIRSFNKVFIMFLPIILSPYFVFLGIKSQNTWEPYYIAILVSFVFSTLQGVQDKLDDPFDGMSEDDIDLDTIDEWTFGSLEHTMKRTFDIGRFKVTVDPNIDPKEIKSPILQREVDASDNVFRRKNSSTYIKPLLRPNTRDYSNYKEDHVDILKYAPLLEGMKGNTRITKKSIYRKSSEITEDKSNNGNDRLETIFEPITITDVNKFQSQPEKKVSFPDQPVISPDIESVNFMAYPYEEVNDSLDPLLPANPVTGQSFECFPQQEYVQCSNINDMLCSHSDHNIPLIMATDDNRKIIPDNKQLWVETCNISSNHSETPDTHNSTSIGKRFCVKPALNKTNNLCENIQDVNQIKVKTKEMDSLVSPEKDIHTKGKCTVVPIDQMKNLDMSEEVKNSSHAGKVEGVNDLIKYHVDDDDIHLDNSKSLLLKYPDSVPICISSSPSFQSSDEHIPPVSFLHGATNVNNGSVVVSVNDDYPSTQTSSDIHLNETEPITNNRGVFGFLGNIRDTINTYTPGAMSTDFVNITPDSETRNEQIDRQISSSF